MSHRSPITKATRALLLALLAWPLAGAAGIPATPVMTLYAFNSDLEIPYYDASRWRSGKGSPAGTLAQGTSLIPCLVMDGGRPLTDGSGTPYVGFEIVVDARRATPADTQRFKDAVARRKGLTVANHHCPPSRRQVIDVRKLYALEKAPFFDPAPARKAQRPEDGVSTLDTIVRAFHASAHCARAGEDLIGRRAALGRAWEAFMRDEKGRWSGDDLARAKHLDYTLRTALFEGHLERGCNAYGACERNIVALSIRNRARGQCLARQGCRFPGDFQGAASSPSQYNIWDEYLTQISGLTSCFLRPDLTSDYYKKLAAMSAQGLPDMEAILFGDDDALAEIFPGTPRSNLTSLRHYYHAPAMGKCFPGHDRMEYMSGAVAERDGDFALLANTRIEVGDKAGGGYAFREFRFTEAPEGDQIRVLDSYPGFVVDGRKVDLKRPAPCPAWGIPAGCRTDTVGRYRRTPSWLASGRPVAIGCRVADRGESCRAEPKARRAEVGGVCDKEMRPVAGVE